MRDGSRHRVLCFVAFDIIQIFVRLLVTFASSVCLSCLFFLRQVQAAEYEQSLAARVGELKANALAQEAAVREQEQLDFRHAERLQVRLAGLQSFEFVVSICVHDMYLIPFSFGGPCLCVYSLCF